MDVVDDDSLALRCVEPRINTCVFEIFYINVVVRSNHPEFFIEHHFDLNFLFGIQAQQTNLVVIVVDLCQLLPTCPV